MSDQQQRSSAGPAKTHEACLTLLEAEIGQRTHVPRTTSAASVGGEVMAEAHDVLVNGNTWEWWKVFHLRLSAWSPIGSPICVSTIGSSKTDCNIFLQHDEIEPVHCEIYAQLYSGYDYWIVHNLSDTVIQYSNDDRFSEIFHASDPGQTLRCKRLARGQIALHRLRGLVVGPFTFNLRVPSSKLEIEQRACWFNQNPAGLVSERILKDQTTGRDLTRADLQVISLIGQGGFGKVEEVMEKTRGLKFAMKTQILGNERVKVQVRNEIHNMKRLRNEFIVEFLTEVRSKWDNDSYSFICMPLYMMDLDAALQHPDFSIDMKDRAMYQVATGLGYIHEQDMLHRDVKPGNILIACMKPVKAVIADLGVSASITNEPYLTGTKTYWAPEYQRHKIPTIATDVFALGLTFLKMIEHSCTDVEDGIPLLAYSTMHHPRRWPVLIKQMTYASPGDRPHLHNVRKAIQGGQDLTPDGDRDRRNASLPVLIPSSALAGQPSRLTPVWEGSSASHSIAQNHTAPYEDMNVECSSKMNRAQPRGGKVDEAQSLGLGQTVRPSSPPAVGDCPTIKPLASGTRYSHVGTQEDAFNTTKSLPHGHLTSDAHIESPRAQHMTLPPRISPRNRRLAKRDDPLRRVRTGRIAKPKATSGSNHTSDMAPVKVATPSSWRAAKVARELEKTGPVTR